MAMKAYRLGAKRKKVQMFDIINLMRTYIAQEIVRQLKERDLRRPKKLKRSSN